MRALSDVAIAQIKIAKGGEFCSLCFAPIPKGDLMVIGTSLNQDYGYIGGVFHAIEWLARNYHPQNAQRIRRALKMVDELGTPEVKNFGDTSIGQRDWDYTHKDLLDKIVIVLSATKARTQYGKCFICQCIVDDQQVSVLMGGDVLVKQIKQLRAEMPFRALLVKPGAYYTFADPSEAPEENQIPF